MKLRTIAVLLAALSAPPIAVAVDASDCTACHDAGEFAEMTPDAIVAAVKDAGIPPHRRFSDASEEDLRAIAAALAGKK